MLGGVRRKSSTRGGISGGPTSHVVPSLGARSITMKKQGDPPSGPKDKSTYPPHREQPETFRRRLVVAKKAPATNTNKTTSATQRMYRRIRRPSVTETRDAAGQVIMQNRRHAPHVLNASVWLDTLRYIKQSSDASTTRSGTEGARRLLRGRAEWTHVVRKHVRRGTATEYELHGHGVPSQLLQDHISYWHDQYEAIKPYAQQVEHDTSLMEPSNKGLWELHATSSAAAAVTEPHHVQRALVRRVRTTIIPARPEEEEKDDDDDENKTRDPDLRAISSVTHRLPISSYPSPFDTPDQNEEESPENISLQLYLTVMHRLASTLAVVLDDNVDDMIPGANGTVSRWHVVVSPYLRNGTAPLSTDAKIPRLSVVWQGRQVFVHLVGQVKSDNSDGDSEVDSEGTSGGNLLHITYQGHIQRPAPTTVA